MENTDTESNTGATLNPMTVAPKPFTQTITVNQATGKPKTDAVKKGRAYYKREMQKATFAFYRSGRAVADLLLDARLTLSPDEFQQFLSEDCQFDVSLVYKFLKMAADFRLNDPANQLHLPEAWTLRYEIMMMHESTFRIGLTKGILHPDCKLEDLKSLRTQLEEPKRKKKTDGEAKETVDAKGGEMDPAPGADPSPKPTVAADAATASEEAPVSAAAGESQHESLGASVKAPNAKVEIRVFQMKASDPAPAKGYLSIVISRSLAERHTNDLVKLKNELETLTGNYPFIGIVEMKVAA